MSGQNLFLSLFLIPLINIPPAEAAPFLVLKKDTIHAGNLFRKAQKYQNDAVYDSAAFYYELAAKEYGQKIYLGNFIKCRNNIIIVRKSAGQTNGLLEDAFLNLKACRAKYGESDELYGECLKTIGNLYLTLNNQDSALFFLRKAESILEKKPPVDKRIVAGTFRDMAVAFIAKGKFDSASYYIEKSSDAYSEISSPDSSELVEIYKLAGTVSYYLGHFKECRRYFSIAVKIREKYSGLSHPLTAQAYNNLAVACYALGLYDTALVLNNKALEIRILKLPPGHSDIALSLNNIGNIYIEKGEFETAADYHSRALEIRQKTSTSENADIAMSYANLGVLYYKMGRYNEALEYFLRYLEISEKIFGRENPHTSDAYNNVGAAYEKLGNTKKSLTFLKEALALRKKRGDYSPGISTSYYNIGSIYKSEGDYDLALSYFRNSINVIMKIQGSSHPDLVGKYNSIGEIFSVEGMTDSAMTYFNRAINLGLMTPGTDNQDLATVFLNRGNLFGHLKQPVSEIGDYRCGSGIARKALGEYHPVVADIYIAISDFLLKEGNKDSALIYRRKAMEIRERSYPQCHPVLSAAYRDMGTFHLKTDDFDSARIFYWKSLQSVYTQPIPYSGFNTSLIIDKYEFALTIFELCRLDYNEYLLRHDEGKLIDITALYGYVKPLINSVISDYTLDETRIRLLNQLSVNTVYAVDAANILFSHTGNKDYFDKAFRFSEINKSGILKNLDYRFGKEKFAAVPDELLLKRKNLLGYIDFLQMKLIKQDRDKAKINYGTIPHKIDSLMLNLREVNDSINFCTERISGLNIQDDGKLIERIRSQMNEEEGLISYFVSDSVLFSFVITRDTARLFKNIIRNKNSPEILVREYVSALKKYDRDKIPQLNSELYRLLFGSFDKIVGKKEKLIIIPDKYLFFLPFETLCKRMNPVKEFGDFAGQDYLIKKFDIVYHYSAGLWSSFSSVPLSSGKRFIAFAPVFPAAKKETEAYPTNLEVLQPDNDLNRRSFRELPFSLDEVVMLKKLFNDQGFETSVLTYNQASEEKLKQDIDKYNYIHLATHGISDDRHPEYSGLAFSAGTTGNEADSLSVLNNDGILYAKELYQLQTHADLVTMSACESGTGKLEEGEGIIGLIRGFLSAGAKNILFSFWKVGDKTALSFMNDFYGSVLSGHSYSNALKAAKIKMINQPETSFPLIWGSFALIGR